MNQQLRPLKVALFLLGALFILSFIFVTPTRPVFAQMPASLTISVSATTAWSGPGRGFWSLTTVRRGQILPIIGISPDRQWWQVNTTKGTAYIYFLDATASNADGVAVIDTSKIGIIPSGVVIVRNGPGFEAAQQGKISKGMQFYIVGTRPDGQWIEILYRFGKGWVKTSLTSLASSATVSNTAPSVGDPVAIVNAGALNVRTGPSDVYKSLGRVVGGTTMKIIGKTADGIWLQVESPFGKGWVNANHVITKNYFGSVSVTTDQAADAEVQVKFKVLGGTASVRQGAGVEFEKLFTVNAGLVCDILGQSRNGWWYVNTPFGKGWINKSLGQASGALNTVPYLD